MAQSVLLPVYRLVSAAAKLFQRHDADSGAKGPAQPQNQLRQVPLQSSSAYGQAQSAGAYVQALSQLAQNGHRWKVVEQSRSQPQSSWQVRKAANASVVNLDQGTVLNWLSSRL